MAHSARSALPGRAGGQDQVGPEQESRRARPPGRLMEQIQPSTSPSRSARRRCRGRAACRGPGDRPPAGRPPGRSPRRTRRVRRPPGWPPAPRRGGGRSRRLALAHSKRLRTAPRIFSVRPNWSRLGWLKVVLTSSRRSSTPKASTNPAISRFRRVRGRIRQTGGSGETLRIGAHGENRQPSMPTLPRTRFRRDSESASQNR